MPIGTMSGSGGRVIRVSGDLNVRDTVLGNKAGPRGGLGVRVFCAAFWSFFVWPGGRRTTAATV